MDFDKSAPGTRKTIASVLKAVGDENAKLPTAPQIDCNYLRDPNNIPRASGTFSSEEGIDKADYSGLLLNYLNHIN